MLGAIAGDIIGSVHEFHPWQGNWRDFPLFTSKSSFTDDSVLSLAVAQAIMDNDIKGIDFDKAMVENIYKFGHLYPKAGYGQKFFQWLLKKGLEPYNSFGNGSAMRVSPVAWAYDILEEVEKNAAISASVTHNHPEGIKGACAVAGSIFLARKGAGKDEIKNYVANKYGYDLNRNLEDIRKNYRFDETCQGSVPEAIIAFLESDNFEEAVRKAVWLRGDADTQADIAGSIAEGFYGIPEDIAKQTLSRLDEHLGNVYANWRDWLNRNK